jgi:broad-specificity NMP kinase
MRKEVPVNQEIVTIVSGLPRSGTSMMMKMLEAGGIEPLTDHVREADKDNPKGYYEFERVKQLEHDKAWVADAQGKVVKVISALLKHLPDDYTYRVIFMRRKIEEILASQRKMLIRRGEDPDKVDDVKMAQLFERHLKQVQNWMAEQPNVEVIEVSFNETVQDPMTQAEQVDEFLGGGLDIERMVNVVDPALYRQRR